MEANAGLVAGSHKRNELVVIPAEGIHGPRRTNQPAGELGCKICGDPVGLNLDGEQFVACNECAFPVCRGCYEYERKEGNSVCPHCQTRYKRQKGSARVAGDEEDDLDDLENEFEMDKLDQQESAENAFMPGRMNFGTRYEQEVATHHMNLHQPPRFPMITDGQVGDSEDDENHALVVPGDGRRVHPLNYHDSNLPVQARPMDPTKDLAAYGYGSVAWKDKVDDWKQRQAKLQMMMSDGGVLHPKDMDGDPLGPDLPIMDESRQPLSRKLPVASARINPYRLIIVLRLVILAFFLRYRILHPVEGAFGLWITSVVCEIWFAVSWILDQFPKWLPIERETYLDRLSLRYEKPGAMSQLANVDVYVCTVDPLKEPPIVTANTILSILAVDYPVDKVSCYLSDDGAAMLSFEALSETSEFARKWVPFCKKYQIEPRAPEMYFALKIDYLKDKVQPTFVSARRAMKREYEEFKVRVNALVAKALKVPEDGWTMQDGTPWPGNNRSDHPGMIQVFLGHSGGLDTDGNELPRLVYVSREKRPGFDHHKKAGAMNALVRVSAVLTNAPYMLNLDCDHYINNSKAIREAMCFMMDPNVGPKVCYVQFPQRFDGIDRNDRYANHNTVFFDINMKGLDGIQGPVYVGTGCVFRRQALYGYEPPSTSKKGKDGGCCSSICPSFCCGPRKKKSKKSKKYSKKSKLPSGADSSIPIFRLEDVEEGMDDGIADVDHDNNMKNRSSSAGPSIVSTKDYEKRFGQSPVFVASTMLDTGGIHHSASAGSLLKEAIHVISCGYESKTEWGKEIGWIYGSVTEDILTGFKMHCRGWRSIYCMPKRPAFKGSAPINLSDRLNQVLRWALGSVEISLSRHCPLWYGFSGNLKCLERLAYINTTVYPLTSLPLVAYCTLPAVCLLTGKFIIPTISGLDSLYFIGLFMSIFITGILEMRWSGVGIEEWWRNEQFWVIGGVSAHLFALFQGLLKVLAGIDTNFTVTSKQAEDEDFGELYLLKWSSLLIPPTTLLVINLVGVVAGISDAINNGYSSWGPLFGKLFFAFWVIVHLYPFLKGLMGRQNRTPTIVIVWSILLASIFSLLWVRINPFVKRDDSLSLVNCGLTCT